MFLKNPCFKQVCKYARLRKQWLVNFGVYVKQLWHFLKVNTK